MTGFEYFVSSIMAAVGFYVFIMSDKIQYRVAGVMLLVGMVMFAASHGYKWV